MLGLTLPQITLFALLIAVCAGIVTEKLRLDIAALIIILTLFCSGILKSDEALAGFISEPAIVIACVFVLSAALYRTGVSQQMGEWVGKLAGDHLPRMLAVLMPAAALMSAFTHHVTITAVLLPVAVSMAARRKMPASKLLMPLAMGSSLGTTATVIAAPSWLVASQLLQQAGRPGLSMFSIAPIGIALTIAGTLYFVLFGGFLLPERKGAEDPSDRFKLDKYLTEVRILEDSELAGKTLRELHEMPDYGFDVVGVLRGGQRVPASRLGGSIREGDVLLVEAPPEDLVQLRLRPGVELEPEVQYAAAAEAQAEQNGNGHDGPSANAQKDAPEPNEELLQVVVAPDSSLVGRSLSGVNFMRRYGAVVLGLWRKDRPQPEELARTRLQAGDVLVLQGDDESLAGIAQDNDFLMMVPFQAEVRQPRRQLLAAAIMLGTIVIAALHLLPLSMALLAGATAMVVSGCVTPTQAYRAIDQRMYLFIAGAIPLGTAMGKTGAATLLAGWLQALTSGWSVVLILFAIYIAVGVLVQFMGSDSATTAIFAPVAIAFASKMGVVPEPFVLAVAMAAVTATFTPFSHHNLLIYAPGGYKFWDYIKVSGPLTIGIGAIVAVMAPMLWH
ncbi:MAG TPA: SLC13 family permease [Chloroflexota bacterium]|jgi:di/tricarboxylate transporter|nr:SLC13 family permease [Chloroflexota bacterium]